MLLSLLALYCFYFWICLQNTGVFIRVIPLTYNSLSKSNILILCTFDKILFINKLTINKDIFVLITRVIEPFWIESEMCGLVLDIASAETGPGGKVITWDKGSTPKTNQLWYEDKKGLIRSCLNDFQFDGSSKFPAKHETLNQCWFNVSCLLGYAVYFVIAPQQRHHPQTMYTHYCFWMLVSQGLSCLFEVFF